MTPFLPWFIGATSQHLLEVKLQTPMMTEAMPTEVRG